MRKIIKAVKRPKKYLGAQRGLIIYDLCIVGRSSHRNKVFEKLGYFSLRAGIFSLNPARLVWFLSRDICLSGRTAQLLEKLHLFPYGASRFFTQNNV